METLQSFLEQVARRGSWIGGGSAAALSAAVAAALLEKLAAERSTARAMHRIRVDCTALIDRDATTFARAIRATRGTDRRAFTRALKAATAIQQQVHRHARLVQRVGRTAKRSIAPKFQSDVRCALALARGAEECAHTLIRTNLAWLEERSATHRPRRHLRTTHRKGRARVPVS